MTRWILLSFILIFIASSCKEDQPPIAPDKMTAILTDLHIAETYATLLPIDKGGYMVKNTDTLLWMYSQIYKKHNIDSASLKVAIHWYELNPEKFDKVYENVLTKISILKEIGLDTLDAKIDTVKTGLDKDSVKVRLDTL